LCMEGSIGWPELRYLSTTWISKVQFGSCFCFQFLLSLF
jgi:hypothetical protein